MNMQDILHTIHSMDRSDTERVLEAARMRRDYLSRAATRVGTTVQFDAGKRGIIVGTVVKINPKRTKIKTNTGTVWTVPHSLLVPTGA